jgi:hypothetical protein
MNEIIIHWNQIYKDGSEINDDTVLNTLFADDQVLLSDLDDNLQRALYTLDITSKQCGVRISPIKSIVMTSGGLVPIRNKIVLDNTILE